MNKERRQEYQNLLKEILKKENTKKCSKCKQILPATPEYFYRRKNGKFGLDHTCKVCKKKWDKVYHRVKKHDVNTTQFFSMLENQNHKCDICKQTLHFYDYGGVHIDHNHKTGEIRKILCFHCNVVLGLINDNRFVLANAILYLKKHRKRLTRKKLTTQL
ncbi:MAG: endonuclease domain-containing protein [Candidatus Lokiarchaeia archaeon]